MEASFFCKLYEVLMFWCPCFVSLTRLMVVVFLFFKARTLKPES